MGKKSSAAKFYVDDHTEVADLISLLCDNSKELDAERKEKNNENRNIGQVLSSENESEPIKRYFVFFVVSYLNFLNFILIFRHPKKIDWKPLLDPNSNITDDSERKRNKKEV